MVAIDKIVFKGKGNLTPDQWKALPFVDRVQAMSKGDVEFFAGGQNVPPKDAIAQLR